MIAKKENKPQFELQVDLFYLNQSKIINLLKVGEVSCNSSRNEVVINLSNRIEKIISNDSWYLTYDIILRSLRHGCVIKNDKIYYVDYDYSFCFTDFNKKFSKKLRVFDILKGLDICSVFQYNNNIYFTASHGKKLMFQDGLNKTKVKVALFKLNNEQTVEKVWEYNTPSYYRTLQLINQNEMLCIDKSRNIYLWQIGTSKFDKIHGETRDVIWG